jgi:hypothetical protein
MYHLKIMSLSQKCRAVRGLSYGFAASLFAFSNASHAHTFCVTTAQELQDALTQSATGGMYNGEDNTLYIAQGVYKTGAATGNGPFHYTSSAATGYLNIRGGYGPNCSTFAFDSTRARLDGNHASQVLALLNQNADIIISQLTIQNGEATTNGGGIAIASGATPTVTLTIIKDNHTTAQGGGLAIYAVGSDITDYVHLDTNLITNNSADQDAGAGILSATTAYIGVTRNTVYGNTTAGSGPSSTGTGGLVVNSDGYISNNIFKQNTLYGAYLGVSGIFFSYNDYGAIGGNPFDPGSTGNTTVAADFVDAAGGNFRLAGTSPLLGYTPDVIGTFRDIENHAYPRTGKGDLGPYAETIFTDGFESN